MNMKAMIKSGDWLSDEHMYLAQAILQKQFPAIDGWQSTLLAQIMGLFLQQMNQFKFIWYLEITG